MNLDFSSIFLPRGSVISYIFFPNLSMILWTQNLDFLTWCLNASQGFGGAGSLMASVFKFFLQGVLSVRGILQPDRIKGIR